MIDIHAKEAKERWGHTDAYKQSEERLKKMSNEDMEKIKNDAESLNLEIVKNMEKGAESKEVQDLIEKHYNALRNFYEPTHERYRGLADMYVSDPRFTAYYEKYAKGLAQFMHDAMIYYVDTKHGQGS